MTDRKPAARARSSATATKKRYGGGFTDEEKGAMKARVAEMRAGDKDDEAAVRAKIAEMPPADRAMAERIHRLVKTSAPELAARLWYGMPAYAKNGKIVCHFQPAEKFKTRYATFNFSDQANLDDGQLWPVGYALGKLTPADEARIAELVRKAVL